MSWMAGAFLSLLVSRPIVLVVLGLLLLEGLLVLLSPDGPLSVQGAHAFDAAISETDVMIPAKIAVNEGDPVVLRLTAARAVVFHLHGYDLRQEVAPGQAATLSFRASLVGRFDIDDEKGQTRLGTLIVQSGRGR